MSPTQHPSSYPIKIYKLHAREVLDSRGTPTVEVEMEASRAEDDSPHFVVSALTPSGASTGEGEAMELRDGDKTRHLGKGVKKAVQNVKTQIAEVLVGREWESQIQVDRKMNEMDGTAEKTKLGANAILPVSMCVSRAFAMANQRPLFAQIRKDYDDLAAGVHGVEFMTDVLTADAWVLPVPLMNVINGGKHADNGLAIQEFMLVPHGFSSFSDALRAGCETFHHLKKILHDRGLSTSVGDEGGFAPALGSEKSHEKAIELILEAIAKAGYQKGSQIAVALDCAASEFCGKEDGKYQFEGQKWSASQMIDIYGAWIQKYPIVSIEDGLAEHDWAGWAELTQKWATKCQLVGDDLFCTNPKFLRKGFSEKVANSILIKLNQIGTVTETLETMLLARSKRYTQISSHRSGETEDAFIADLAVATNCGQIKTGSASRTDRMAKYNQLLRIEERLGERAVFAGSALFRK